MCVVDQAYTQRINTPAPPKPFMGGETHTPPGERIPRRSPPEYEELDESYGLASGLFVDGLVGMFRNAFNDTNKYGPHAMIVTLIIVASVTGGLLFLASKA